MISLHSRGEVDGLAESVVGLVRWTTDDAAIGVFTSRTIFNAADSLPAVALRVDDRPIPHAWAKAALPTVSTGSALQPLVTGDIVAVHPSGRIATMFRCDSDHNSLFVTEQCNSHCLMCSQPPRRVDDIAHFLTLNARALRLMPSDVSTLGITGGEPTLLGDSLVELLRMCQEVLPRTQLEVLSNGRRLSDWEYAVQVGEVCNKRVLFSIPLYADNSLRHDYIVQAAGAFEQTVLGLYHLASVGVRCELRVVLHRESVGRLPALAQFIQRNLPFVEQVAFMGLEMTGLARANHDRLWCEPEEYASPLKEAVTYLSELKVRVSLYNHPKCLVDRSLWPYLRQSISDWKRVYLPACDRCCERASCGGLFGTSSRLSDSISPFAC